MATILVTGASGFVGKALCAEMVSRGLEVRAAVRDGVNTTQNNAEVIPVGDLSETPDWRAAVLGVSAVVHLAARVHVMNETAVEPLAAFRAVNVNATRDLAIQAVTAGVRRFVYVSSIKVNGEETTHHPFTSSDDPAPEDPYGQSKLEAELALRQIADRTGLEVCVVRPPLVYGPGVRGNFLRLLKLAQLGIPLPFAAINNRRSMIYVGNLCDALIACALHQNAAGKTFLVSDGEPFATPHLIALLARALRARTRLFSVPPFMLGGMGRLAGRSLEVNRLISSLVADDSDIRRDLKWLPPFSADEGLNYTAQWFLARSTTRKADRI